MQIDSNSRDINRLSGVNGTSAKVAHNLHDVLSHLLSPFCRIEKLCRPRIPNFDSLYILIIYTFMKYLLFIYIFILNYLIMLFLRIMSYTIILENVPREMCIRIKICYINLISKC